MADFDPVALAVDWLDACKRNDWESLSGLYADDVTATLSSENPTAPGGVLRGVNEVAAYWKAAFRKPHGSIFELVEVYPGVDSVVLIYYDEHCHRVSEFLKFNTLGLIVLSARHAIPRHCQEPALLGAANISASPIRKAVLRCEARKTLHEARRLPAGPTRNDLRQRAIALRELSDKSSQGPGRDFAIG